MTDSDDRFIATFHPRRPLSDTDRHHCRRALPHIRQWYAEHGHEYASPEEAVGPCQFVVSGILLSIGIIIFEDIVADLILAELRRIWSGT